MSDFNDRPPNNKKSKRNRGFSSLGTELDKLLDQQQTGHRKVYGLLKAWYAVAQEAVIEHTDNAVYDTKSKETELLIFVDDSAWAAELTMNKELYRLLMEKQLDKPITNIKFLVSRTAAYRKKNK